MSKTYITKQGDMWDSIAHSQLGSTAYTDRLMQCNAQYLAYYIFPGGIVLELPQVYASSQEVSTLPPWKKVAG